MPAGEVATTVLARPRAASSAAIQPPMRVADDVRRVEPGRVHRLLDGVHQRGTVGSPATGADSPYPGRLSARTSWRSSSAGSTGFQTCQLDPIPWIASRGSPSPALPVVQPDLTHRGEPYPGASGACRSAGPGARRSAGRRCWRPPRPPTVVDAEPVELRVNGVHQRAADAGAAPLGQHGEGLELGRPVACDPRLVRALDVHHRVAHGLAVRPRPPARTSRGRRASARSRRRRIGHDSDAGRVGSRAPPRRGARAAPRHSGATISSSDGFRGRTCTLLPSRAACRASTNW